MSFNSYNKGVKSADDMLKAGTGYCARPDPKRMEPPEYDISKFASDSQAGSSGQAQPRALGRAGSYDSLGATYKDPSKNKEFIDPKYAFLFKGKKKPVQNQPQQPGANVTDRISYSGFGGTAGSGKSFLHSAPTRRMRDPDEKRGIDFGWVYTRAAVAVACAITVFTLFSVTYANKGVRPMSVDPHGHVRYGN